MSSPAMNVIFDDAKLVLCIFSTNYRHLDVTHADEISRSSDKFNELFRFSSIYFLLLFSIERQKFVNATK